ncbi:hypothetical protein XENOCAPTIV_014842 [Xenoophorus captivus]|uniref:Uncharacterized protein n=1 Tax=Xenoophorus captivus TaxID=1517983 RepID=A0ABV0RUD1_9TELE
MPLVHSLCFSCDPFTSRLFPVRSMFSTASSSDPFMFIGFLSFSALFFCLSCSTFPLIALPSLCLSCNVFLLIGPSGLPVISLPLPQYIYLLVLFVPYWFLLFICHLVHFSAPCSVSRYLQLFSASSFHLCCFF